MSSNEERLATLEVEVDNLKESLDSVNEKLDILIASMNKMKGFWAGVVAAGTALGAALGALLSYIFHAKIG